MESELNWPALERKLVTQALNDRIVQLLAGALVVRNQKILVLRRKKSDFLGGTWEFPSGKLEAGETIQNALFRAPRTTPSPHHAVHQNDPAGTLQTIASAKIPMTSTSTPSPPKESYDFSRPIHYTASVFILHNNRLLLLKQNESAYWRIPGGHVEDHELPHEAAIREVFEETNLRIEILEKADESARTPIVTPLPPPHHVRLLPCRDKKDLDFVFTGRVLGGKLQINHESTDAQWFSLADINADPRIGPNTRYYANELLQPRQNKSRTIRRSRQRKRA